MIIVQQDNEIYKHENGSDWDYSDGALCVMNGKQEVVATYSRWDWVKRTPESNQPISLHIQADEALRIAEASVIAARAATGRFGL